MAQDDSHAEDRTPMVDGRDDAVWKLQDMDGRMTLGAAALPIEHDLACSALIATVMYAIDPHAPHATFTSYLKPS